MVKFVYLDESYDRDFFWIAALVIPDAQLPSLDAALHKVIEEAVKKCDTPPYAELHGHSIVNAKEAWKPLEGKRRAKFDIYGAAMRAIGEHDVEIVIRGVKIDRLQRRNARREPPHQSAYERALGHTLAVVDTCASDQDEYAMVIADECDDPAKQRRNFHHLRTEGAIWYRGRRLTRIVDTIYFAPSRDSRMLQAADLIAYSYRRLAAADREGHDSRAAWANEQLWAHVSGRLRHDGAS
jgi:hypothetical protein